MSHKYNLGDTVRVIDNGYLYSTFVKYGTKYTGWENGREPKRRTKYTIIGKHEDDYGACIYAIQNASGQVYIYGEGGIELLPEKKKVLSSSTEPFQYPAWIQIKPYDGVDKTGLVIDLRKHGESNQPACWRTDEGWSCNQSFRYNLTPLEASIMLMALQDVEDNRP